MAARTGFGKVCVETSYIFVILHVLSLFVLFYFGTTHGQEVTESPICGSTMYDMETLKALPYWTITKPGICYDAWDDPSKTCIMKLAFCRTLPPSETGGAYYVGAAQLALNLVGAKPLILGLQSEIVDDNSHEELIVTYADGGQVNCGRMSVIMYLRCNPNAQWEVPDSKDPAEIPGLTQVYLDSTNTTCLYSIFADYAGACDLPAAAQLSAGSVIIIIFLCAVTIYLVGGVIYNGVKGASGRELIPNYEMWRNFPDDVITGCDFFFKTVTCQGGATASSEGYDQI